MEGNKVDTKVGDGETVNELEYIRVWVETTTNFLGRAVKTSGFEVVVKIGAVLSYTAGMNTESGK